MRHIYYTTGRSLIARPYLEIIEFHDNDNIEEAFKKALKVIYLLIDFFIKLKINIDLNFN